LRGATAIAVAIAALTPLPLMRLAVNGSLSSSSGIGGRAQYEYSLGELPWSLVATSVLLSVAIAVAAAGLWAAHDRRVLVATIAVGMVGAIAIPIVTPSSLTDPVSLAEHRSLPLGIDREELEDRLGRPAGSATASTPIVPGVRLDCVVYNGTEPWEHPMYCFDQDRLVYKDRVN
jgi:hypothetical protein